MQDMKVFAGFLGFLCLLVGSSSAQERPWRLVWSDEFDGPSLDYSKWEIEVNAFGGGNHELQIYTDATKNVRVERGVLVLEAHRERASIQGTERDLSSGRIRSKNRGDWKYGKFEMRAKLPAGQGVWPAFWMLPTEDRYGGWASSGEIDILEFKGQEPDTLWGTLHYGGRWPNNRHTGEQKKFPNLDFTTDFHQFAIEWEEGKIRWLLDGEVWQEQSRWESEEAPFPAPFDQRFHVVLNLAIGGGFVGDPAPDTPFPAQYLIDWVRVYQDRSQP
ncbi:MAG: family 16 glycosylhydrolase [Pirellulaceae bacterium]